MTLIMKPRLKLLNLCEKLEKHFKNCMTLMFEFKVKVVENPNLLSLIV